MGFYGPSPRFSLDTAVGTGYVVETGVFCIYTYMFFAALPMLTSTRRLQDLRRARSAKVFLVMSVLMYLVATLHLIAASFRFYKGIILKSTFQDRKAYLINLKNWDFLGSIALTHIQTWLGDALVIYRCFVIWDNNWWIISIPLFLLLATIGVHCVALYWLSHKFTAAPVVNSLYPLVFTQNFLTTGLIILKIFLQHRRSKKAGIEDLGSRLNLIRIIRVVIESAAIYTIQLLLMIILYFRSNQLQFVVQASIIPSIGITFLLLAIRIETSRKRHATGTYGIRTSVIPPFISESSEDSEIDNEDREGGLSNPRNGSPTIQSQRGHYRQASS